MWRKIWKEADRTLTILFFITLPFFLYFVATEAFRAQTPEDIFDLCYNHQMNAPKSDPKYSAAYAPLLTAIQDDLAIDWQLAPPFGFKETARPGSRALARCSAST
ncbi:hypothetical protein [Arvimicrobium flavum]|uniref:hypothetical protein n=1 Tax=Arvimicrobium flavum TaxID=3393320 RepID=UPI00237C47A0|nr:hypothetical protein [Mesorhizobium shangrilense]